MSDEESKLTMETISEAVESEPSAVRDHLPTTGEIADALKRAAERPAQAAPQQEPAVDVAMERGREVFRMRVPQRLHRLALREFKEWKHTLSEILRREARMAWSVRDGKPVYQFVLPAKLVRLVWNTTINERVKMEMRRQPEGAAKRALETIQGEVTDLVERIVADQSRQELEAVPEAASENHASEEQPPEASPEEQDALLEEPTV